MEGDAAPVRTLNGSPGRPVDIELQAQKVRVVLCSAAAKVEDAPARVSDGLEAFRQAGSEAAGDPPEELIERISRGLTDLVQPDPPQAR